MLWAGTPTSRMRRSRILAAARASSSGVTRRARYSRTTTTSSSGTGTEKAAPTPPSRAGWASRVAASRSCG